MSAESFVHPVRPDNTLKKKGVVLHSLSHIMHSKSSVRRRAQRSSADGTNFYEGLDSRVVQLIKIDNVNVNERKKRNRDFIVFTAKPVFFFFSF